MRGAAGVAWDTVFVPDQPVLEILARGTAMYLVLFALLRFVLKRQSGALSVTDLLVVVLIADASQNAMSDDYRAVPDGILLVAVIVFWAWFLDWLGFRFPAVNRIVKPPPLELVRDGQPLWRNMARELVTLDELESALREHGIDDLSEVRSAHMEGGGRISAIPKDHSQQTDPGPSATQRTL